jgi:glyoxalase family protein
MTHPSDSIAESRAEKRKATVKATRRRLLGIHHVTALVSDVQRSLDFYTRILGLRLVKRTVNFDDPAGHHLFFGNRTGEPGTLITLVSSRDEVRRQEEPEAISFSIPKSSLKHWQNHFEKLRIPSGTVRNRFQETCLAFSDPDGLPLELIAGPEEDLQRPCHEESNAEYLPVRGLYSVTLTTGDIDATVLLLERCLGLSVTERAPDRIRLVIAAGGPGCCIDLSSRREGAEKNSAGGRIFNLAWRAGTTTDLEVWRSALAEKGIAATPAVDRLYFRSSYFRDPGGILFELTTDRPGLTLDESVEDLGRNLQLPPWLEVYRCEIQAALPELSPAGKVL